jgi:hypothetical protein
MSQPDYPIFNKKWQKDQKNRRGGYNFEKTKEFELAEKWFEERKVARQEYNRPPSPTVQSPPPISLPQAKKGPPPGLNKLVVPTKVCKKCNSTQIIPVTFGCCNNTFCLNCTTFEAELYNRCFSCKSIIDMSKYDEYDGLDLKIPSYDEFDYKDNEEIVPLTHIPLNNTTTSAVLESIIVSDNYSTPLVSQDVPDENVDFAGQGFIDLSLNNYQLYLQYLMMLTMFSQFVPQ